MGIVFCATYAKAIGFEILLDVEFDHGLPCHVKNMARGTQ